MFLQKDKRGYWHLLEKVGGKRRYIKYIGKDRTEILANLQRGQETLAILEKYPDLLAKVRGPLNEAQQREIKSKIPNSTKYPVIYADPPWQYDNAIDAWGPASLHYSTMSTDQICSMRIPSKDNAVLFLWVTNPFLEDGLRVVRAWGFQYKTNITWVKTELKKPGSGFYVRGRHELLFICTKGNFVPNQKGKGPIGSVVSEPVSEHSRKPVKFYKIIEDLYDDITIGEKYLELFAREKYSDRWDVFGNEV